MDAKNEQTNYTLERWIAVILALMFLIPVVAQADGAGLMLKTSKPGVYVETAAVSTDVDIRVTGPIVRTHVRQTFHNDTTDCVEGVYVFPLPEKSAVDTLSMTIGSRVIVGEIRERGQAVREYEQARTEGRRAALVEQTRPNVFTTSVASLPAGEDAVIEIEYQETARFENGEYRLRFPMVVAPRYAPGDVKPGAPATRMTLSVDIQSGQSLRDVHSVNYVVKTQAVGHGHYTVDLADDEVTAGRDFELVWQPDLGSKPAATVLTEKAGDATYAVIVVTPPPRTEARLPRETIFIVDSSGSMEGASMDQAKAALLLALDDLRPGDSFNIIDFDSEARALFPEARSADPAAVETAKVFVNKIEADGGTEMSGALELALADTKAGGVRQVIFMTDGQVGNEQELFTYIHGHLGESRLFTVGIGSAPNSYFMRNAARVGRGTFTYIGDVTQVKDRMGELFAKLASPVMTSIEVNVDDPTAELWPARSPDLYSGEPLVIALRVVDPSAPVTITGRIGDQLWTATLRLPAPVEGSGIARLWAREKIESAMDRLSEGVDADTVRKEVLPVALEHHLLSQYTSLIAVDRTPQGFLGPVCQPREISRPIDEMVDNEGALPQGGTSARLLVLAGLALIALAVPLSRL